MKLKRNASLAAILLSGIILLAGCTATKNKGIVNNTILTGHIDGVKDPYFQFNYDLYSLLEASKKENIDIDEEGNFRIDLSLKSPLKGNLYFGRDIIRGLGHNKNIYIYLEPGDSVHVTANVDFFQDTAIIEKTLGFSGKGAVNNRFVNDADFAFNSYPQLRDNNYGFILTLSPDEYKRNADSIRDEQIRYVSKYYDTAHISPRLKEIFIEESENLASARKINYPSGKKSFSQGKEVDLPADYYNFMDNIHIKSDLENAGVPYLRFTHFYLTNKYKLAQKNGFTGDYISFLDNQLPKRARYVYMAYSLRQDFRPEIFNQFGKGSPFKDIKKIVQERYGYLADMLPGKPAVQVVFEDINKEKIKSGPYFEGKYVYIDFWATWCKPCIAEIPDLVKLEKEYEGKNIEFVSVSFDDGRPEWEEYLEKEKLTGTQFWMDAKNKALYKRQFNIQLIPRFILLDTEGKIVNADAPRPSSGKQIRNLLDQTLSKGS
ncbi:MAG: redoxin family protein [Chitinophagaceae bacterium]|nr:redoxin family protein [Chitinophagaceae bacterium]